MTERTGSLPVATIAGALFCVVLIYLALQIRAGQDPAIGTMQQSAAAPRPVIVRRVVIRRLVEADGASTEPSAGLTAPAAPAPSAPAPAAAPAPAPAPVVSRGS